MRNHDCVQNRSAAYASANQMVQPRSARRRCVIGIERNAIAVEFRTRLAGILALEAGCVLPLFVRVGVVSGAGREMEAAEAALALLLLQVLLLLPCRGYGLIKERVRRAAVARRAGVGNVDLLDGEGGAHESDGAQKCRGKRQADGHDVDSLFAALSETVGRKIKAGKSNLWATRAKKTRKRLKLPKIHTVPVRV